MSLPTKPQSDSQSNYLLMALKQIAHDLSAPAATLKMFSLHSPNLSAADKEMFRGLTTRLEHIIKSSHQKAEDYENKIIT